VIWNPGSANVIVRLLRREKLPYRDFFKQRRVAVKEFAVLTLSIQQNMGRWRVYVLIALSVSAVVRVRCDYPPPSEDRHGYYTHGGGGALAGTGRVTAGFDGEYVGGSSDWHSADWVSGNHGLLGLSHAR